jgi:glycosyltransferase involved in cell wall biosynthesis
MKLIAMMIVHNEIDRYLEPCLASLSEFCDEIRIIDDGSTDLTAPYLAASHNPKIRAQLCGPSVFYQHEGRARQALLEWAMEGQPTHILAIDADEFVGDGLALRAAMEEGCATGVWKLAMTEVWGADEQFVSVRWDGAWKPRPIGIAFAVPPDHWTNRQTRRHWRMHDVALACGRTPLWITMAGNRTAADAVTDILHFGWACEADRADRYQRYVEHDGGQFHQNKHLESIMWGDDQVELRRVPWWPALDKEALLARVNRT